MARIREFDAGNVHLNPSETGTTARAATARRVGAFYNQVASATDELAGVTQRVAGQTERLAQEQAHFASYQGALERGTAVRTASAIDTAGELALRAADHQQISQGAPAFAGLVNAATKQWDDTVKNADPNDPTVAKKFLAGLEPDLEKFKGGFLTERGQAWAEAHVDQFRQHMFTKTAGDMATLAGQAAAVNQRQTVNALSNTVRGDPSSLDFALSTYESTLTSVVASSPNLTGTTANKVHTELMQRGKEAIIKSAAFGYIEKTGEVPAWATENKYSQYIDGTELKQFAQAAKAYARMGQAEERAQREEAKRIGTDDFKAKFTDLEASTMPQKVGDRPMLPDNYWDNVRELAKHPYADPAAVRSMITRGETIAGRANKPEPIAQVSHDTSINLLQRIRATDNTRLQNTDEIYNAYYDAKLNNADFGFLMREWNDNRTADGEKFGQAKGAFFKGVTGQITKSNPLMGRVDPSGDQKLYEFEWFVNRKVEEYKKAGKNPWDLFDPGKPQDYLGAPGVISGFQKTLTQSTQDTARRLSTGNAGGGTPAVKPTPVPRNPGESPEQYLKRIGVQ